MEPLKGKAWKYGDDINTDFIVPGRYLKLTVSEAAAHVMEGVDAEFAKKSRPGDIVVGGRNFGCGSSRESAPAALKQFGVGAVVAKFFARIFFRNAINVGLPVLECPEADQIESGDQLVLDLEAGQIHNLTQGTTYRTTPLSEHIMELMRCGGLLPYLEQNLRTSSVSQVSAGRVGPGKGE